MIFINLSLRKELDTEEKILEILEHFCTSLHGIIDGAFRIEIIDFEYLKQESKVIVKIPFEYKNFSKISLFQYFL